MARVEELHEANPMLGLRGVRLSILFPEITRMQVRAIMEAACDLRKRKVDARPEIMIPLAGTLAELHVVHQELRPVVEKVQKEKGVKVPYKFGTMIEIPRAALTAGEIATEAEFFSFGTNDLTQTRSVIRARRRAPLHRPPLERKIWRATRSDDRRIAPAAPGTRRSRRRGRRWRSGSAGNGGVPTRSTVSQLGLTTCRAACSGCRSPGWRRRRQSETAPPSKVSSPAEAGGEGR
jgi:hypothetical protein